MVENFDYLIREYRTNKWLCDYFAKSGYDAQRISAYNRSDNVYLISNWKFYKEVPNTNLIIYRVSLPYIDLSNPLCAKMNNSEWNTHQFNRGFYIPEEDRTKPLNEHFTKFCYVIWDKTCFDDWTVDNARFRWSDTTKILDDAMYHLNNKNGFTTKPKIVNDGWIVYGPSMIFGKNNKNCFIFIDHDVAVYASPDKAIYQKEWNKTDWTDEDLDEIVMRHVRKGLKAHEDLTKKEQKEKKAEKQSQIELIGAFSSLDNLDFAEVIRDKLETTIKLKTLSNYGGNRHDKAIRITYDPKKELFSIHGNFGQRGNDTIYYYFKKEDQDRVEEAALGLVNILRYGSPTIKGISW